MGKRHPPLTVTWEVKTLGGSPGRLLAQRQAEAVLDLLRWLDQHPPEDDPAPTEPDAV